MEKDKKKTLTISPNFKKKIDASSIESSEKSPIQLKKKVFRNKPFNKTANPSNNLNQETRKKILPGSLLSSKQQRVYKER